MDVPRLSTLQALIIVLKARESAPKRGYYYRSWMSIVQCVEMAKDMGLDEHFADHQAGKPCGSTPAECMLRTRIWQVIFICEVMIGSPQGEQISTQPASYHKQLLITTLVGRTDLSVDVESVDYSVPGPIPNGDESEYHVSRNFTYLARIVRGIGRMNRVYSRIKKTNTWGIAPEFIKLNSELHTWESELPADLILNYPPDGSTPWLPSAFLGNVHSYYHLSIILFHRPQLAFLDPTAADGQWKHHMMICYDAAKTLCKLQEAVLNGFGLTGLLCMLRGINFTIYAVLACVVLHLVCQS